MKLRKDELDAIDACVRIASVLDRAGYEISDLPSLPRVKR